MQQLEERLANIQAAVEDCDEMQWESNLIQDWLGNLNELAYEIDDTLDAYFTERLRLARKKIKIKTNPFSIKRVRHRHKLGRKVKEVMHKLDVVSANRPVLPPIETRGEWRRVSDRLHQPIPQFSRNFATRIHGRLQEKEKLVNFLIDQVNSGQGVTVLPIVGVGGIGKTQLVELLFNDDRVTKHFYPLVWVTAASDFDMMSLLKKMIKYVPAIGTRCEDTDVLPIIRSYIHELFLKNRYLLVLDDVWNDDPLDWRKLHNILDCGAIGSSIIVTTRLEKVARLVSTTRTIYLNELSEEDSWSVFKEHAFAGGNGEEYPKLQAIGKEIVKKSYGVPLVLESLGKFLRHTRTESQWRRIRDTELWNLPNEEAILPTLLSSYYHLPVDTRACFLFCSVFPKGSEIDKNDLLSLWMAHGYISSDERLEAEEVGEHTWEELVLGSIIQDVCTMDGKTKFKIHELLHDLAKFIVQKMFPRKEDINNKRSFSQSRVRHLDWERKTIAFPVRTLPTIEPSEILRFKRLRSLDLSHSTTKRLPSAISKLKHLRLLNLSYTSINYLPETFYKLQNLITLNMEGCTEFQNFLHAHSLMPTLRHLILCGCTSLFSMPPKLHKLIFLRTLSMFLVCQRVIGDQLVELQSLDIRGRIEIRGLERLSSHLDAMKANLAEKQNLHDLVFHWGGNNVSDVEGDMHERVLEALNPHKNVLTLEIMGFKGKNLPAWMRNSTPEKLETLSFDALLNVESLPEGLQQLQKLKNLKLCKLSKLKSVPDWLSKISALSFLLIESCPRVPSLPTTLPEMGNLNVLHIKNCPNLEMRCEKEKGEDWIKISHIPNVLIE